MVVPPTPTPPSPPLVSSSLIKKRSWRQWCFWVLHQSLFGCTTIGTSFFLKYGAAHQMVVVVWGLGVHHHWHQLLFKLRSCSPNGLGAPPWAPASFCIKNCSPIGWWCPHPHTTPHHTHNLVGNSFCNLKQKLVPMVVLPTKIHATPKTPLAPASFFN